MVRRITFCATYEKRVFHEGIKCFPFEAMFGMPAKLGLKTPSLPNEFIKHLRTEEEFQALIEAFNNATKSLYSGKEDVSNMDKNFLTVPYSNFAHVK